MPPQIFPGSLSSADLMDKVDNVVDVNNFMPRSVSDCFKFLFLFFAIFTTFVFEITTVIPYVHPENTIARVVHFVNGLYLLHLIFGHLYLFIRKETSIRNLVLPTSGTPQPGWRFCTSCECHCPPRSYHCVTCGLCILRRDHHCEFAGKCVGYKNYRYYIGLVFAIMAGAAYSAVLNQFFIWEALGGLSFYNLARHAFPLFFMLFGNMSYSLGVFAFISVLDVCGCLFCAGLLLFHGSLMMMNQTNNERTRNITVYDLGHWKDNVTEVMGDSIIKGLLFPFSSSSLSRDGIHFPTREQHALTARKHK